MTGCPNGSEVKPGKSQLADFFNITSELLQAMGVDPFIADLLTAGFPIKIPINPPALCAAPRPTQPDFSGINLLNVADVASKLAQLAFYLAWNEYCQCSSGASIPPPPGNPDPNCSGQGWVHSYKYTGAPQTEYFPLEDTNPDSVWTATPGPGGSGCGLSVRKNGVEQFLADGGCGSTRITEIVFAYCAGTPELPPDDPSKNPPDDYEPKDPPPPESDLPPPESDPPTPPGETEPTGCDKCHGRLDWIEGPPVEDGATYKFDKKACRVWIYAETVPTWDGQLLGRGTYPTRQLQWGEMAWIYGSGRSQVRPLQHRAMVYDSDRDGADGISIYLRPGYRARFKVGFPRTEE